MLSTEPKMKRSSSWTEHDEVDAERTVVVASLAPKTIVNVVTVVKFVVASAVDEEGDQIHPRVWNYEFTQLPLVVKEKQNRPTITEAEISAMLTTLKGRDAVLVAMILIRCAACYRWGGACGGDASKHRKP